MTSWSSLLTSLDAKADHISRAQSEAQSVVNGQLQSVLSATQLGLESVDQKLSEVDSKVGEISSTQEVLGGTVRKISSKLTELHSLRLQSKHRHSVQGGGPHSGQGGHGHACSEMKEKVEKIFDRITSGADDVTGENSDVELSLQQVKIIQIVELCEKYHAALYLRKRHRCIEIPD